MKSMLIKHIFMKIKDNYKRIYIDLPGMGKSDSAEWITNSDIMLDVVIDFIEKIIPNENFNWQILLNYGC